MRRFDSQKEQDKLLSQIERQERQQSFQRDRFMRFKLTELHNRLSQVLLMEKVLETDQPAAVSDLILKGLKQIIRSSEFDFRYFISPIRDLVAHPDPYVLYMTQYIMEVMIKDPSVIEVYGTDVDIYNTVKEVFTQVNQRFDKAEADVKAQLAANKALQPGTRDYDLAMDQLMRKKVGDPQTA